MDARVRKFLAGWPDRPESDVEQLRGIADYLDASDEYLRGDPAVAEYIDGGDEPYLQDDLRRIADRLEYIEQAVSYDGH